MQGTAPPGEDAAWDLLASLDPAEVQARAGVAFDEVSSSYALQCFGQDVRVSMEHRTMSSGSVLGRLLLEDLGSSSRLAILRYLIHVDDAAPAGRLISPAELPGGEIFLRGTHVLPLDDLAARFSRGPDDFLKQGRRLNGVPLEYGDAAIGLAPLPRLPVVLIAYSGDDEFPPRASVAVDVSLVSRLPTDIIWAALMMTVTLMLRDLPEELVDAV